MLGRLPQRKGRKMQRNTELKMSQAGLEHIYKYNPAGRERAIKRRWAFRGFEKDCLNIIIARRLDLPSYRYDHYHKDFLEPV